MNFINSVSEILEIRKIGTNATEGLEEMITEAEEIDIRQFLGASLYKDFKDNKSEQKYLDLLNGTTYTCGNYTIDFPGIKKAILHLGLGRWFVERSLQATRTGMVQKDSDYSTAASSKLLSERVEQERSAAVFYLEETTRFLSNNKDIYTLYEGANADDVKRTRITPIG